MKRYPTVYQIWYELEGFGIANEKITAIDILEAIEEIKKSIRKRWGNEKKIFFVKVEG